MNSEHCYSAGWSKWGFISRGLRRGLQARGIISLVLVLTNFSLPRLTPCHWSMSSSARFLHPRNSIHTPVNLHQGSLLLGHALNTATLFHNALPWLCRNSLLPQLTLYVGMFCISTGSEYPCALLFLHASEQVCKLPVKG